MLRTVLATATAALLGAALVTPALAATPVPVPGPGPGSELCLNAVLALGPLAQAAQADSAALAKAQTALATLQTKLTTDSATLQKDLAADNALALLGDAQAVTADITAVTAAAVPSALTDLVKNDNAALQAALTLATTNCTAVSPPTVTVTPAPTTQVTPTLAPTVTFPLPPLPGQVSRIPTGAGPATGDGSA